MSSSPRSARRRPRPCARYRLRADLVPASYRSEALAEALIREVAGRRILLGPRRPGADDLQGRARAGRRRRAGRRLPQRRRRIAAGRGRRPDRRGVGRLDHADQLRHRVTAACLARRIGPRSESAGRSAWRASAPSTTEAARRLGWEVAAEAEEFTWDGLVAAIVGAEASKSAEGRLGLPSGPPRGETGTPTCPAASDWGVVR